MRIHLTNMGAITLLEPNNFQELDVIIDPQPEDKLNGTVARIGKWDGDKHVRISPSVIRFISCHAGDPTWETKFTEMLFYAEQHGWIDAQGDVRAHISYRDSDSVVSQDEFKAAMRALPAGVSAITTGIGENTAGMIVSSLTSISAEPPMVGFFVHADSSMVNPLTTNGRFVANILGSCHSSLMSSFLSEKQGKDRFKHGNWKLGETTLPVLSDALASIECDIVNTTVLGTHYLVVGKVTKVKTNDLDPMIYFNASTHNLELEPRKKIA